MRSLKLSSNILGKLKSGNIVSGSSLCDENNVSRTAIWKKINILRNEGYDISTVPGKGYLLKGKKECFTPEEIFSKLKTKKIGKNIFMFEKAGSTNDLAYQYASKNEEEGAVFIAEYQTKGRGRMGREWFSPKRKGLWFSIVLKPEFNFSDITIMPLLTALSCAEAIRNSLCVDVKIKWPNDLLINNKKAGGILLEMKAEIDRINFLIIGIGIDVNLNEKDYPEYLKNKAISLKIAKGKMVSRLQILVDILENIEKRYIEYPDNKSEIIKDYSQLCCNLGKMINVETQTGIIKGKALKIEESGCLILKDKHGELIKISSGDIIG